MTEKPEVEIEQILAHFRELVGQQAQEIVLLKATIAAMDKKNKVE